MKAICVIVLITLILNKKCHGTDVIFPEESDFCTEKTGDHSFCMEIGKCPHAQNLIRQGKIPQTCGFLREIPLVCCAMSSFPGLDVTEHICGRISQTEEKSGNLQFPSDNGEHGDSIIQPRNKKRSDADKWPWAVSVARANDSVGICTGLLIDQFYVLTAAHCYLEESNAEDYSIYILQDGRMTLYEISELIIHPEFSGYYDDIALLKTTTAVSGVNPICLPTEKEESDLIEKNAIAINWPTDNNNDGVVSNNMTILEVEVCQQTYQMLSDTPFPSGINKEFICAIPVNPTADICKIDSGELLMEKEDQRWRVIGIGTSGIPCHRPTYPAVYTKISRYLSWLKQIQTG